MTVSHVTIVASDFGDSNLAAGLAEKLRESVLCSALFGEGKIPWDINRQYVASIIEETNIVVLSTSENCSVEVFAAEQAIRLEKPLALMALFHGQLKKREYIPFRYHFKLVFVLDEDEAIEASALYPNAMVVVSGNPEWESFSFPKRSRGEVREILNIAPDEKFILVSGEKEVGVNVPLAVNIIEAIANIYDRELYRVIFTIHPGHRPLPGGADLLEFYKELEEYDKNVHIRFSCRATPFSIGTPDMVAGADVVIGTNSTVQIQAAYLGIPAIAILMRRAFRGITLPQEHKGWWKPCDQGAVAPVYGLSSERTARMLRDLTIIPGAEATPMRVAQARMFPPFEFVGQAYEKMVRAIRSL